LEDGLVSRRAAKNSLLSRKNIRDILIFCTGIGLLRTGVKSFSLMNSLSDCLGHPEKKLVRRRHGERYHQSGLPTIKHPETIHVWGCFSAKEWATSPIQEQFGDEQCLFQHDGAPCHKAKVITQWLGEQNIDILVQGQETPQTLIPLINCRQSSRGGWTNKNPQILKKTPKVYYARMGCHQSGCGTEVN
jgi:hypothetical protein